MAKANALDSEKFDRLLRWLGPTPESAGEKYEEIRHALIKIFLWNGAADAEDLADETINRVANKLPEIISSYEGDPTRYFYGVAKNILRQQPKKRPQVQQNTQYTFEEGNENAELEEVYGCLEECLNTLPKVDKDALFTYYRGEKQEKIEHRKELSLRLGIETNALRVRIHRLRQMMNACVRHCLEQKRGV